VPEVENRPIECWQQFKDIKKREETILKSYKQAPGLTMDQLVNVSKNTNTDGTRVVPDDSNMQQDVAVNEELIEKLATLRGVKLIQNKDNVLGTFVLPTKLLAKLQSTSASQRNLREFYVTRIVVRIFSQ
jgi:hypothetical protein